MSEQRSGGGGGRRPAGDGERRALSIRKSFCSTGDLEEKSICKPEEYILFKKKKKLPGIYLLIK